MLSYIASPVALQANSYDRGFEDGAAVTATAVGLVGAGVGIACALWGISNWCSKKNGTAFVGQMEQHYDFLLNQNNASLYSTIQKINHYPAAGLYQDCPLAKFYDDVEEHITKLTSWIGYVDNLLDMRINILVNALKTFKDALKNDYSYQEQAHIVALRTLEKRAPFLKKYHDDITAFFNTFSTREGVDMLVINLRQHNNGTGIYKNYPLAKFDEELDATISSLVSFKSSNSLYAMEALKIVDALKGIRAAIKADSRFIKELRGLEKLREKERARLLEERKLAELKNMERRLARIEFDNTMKRVFPKQKEVHHYIH